MERSNTPFAGEFSKTKDVAHVCLLLAHDPASGFRVPFEPRCRIGCSESRTRQRDIVYKYNSDLQPFYMVEQALSV